MQPNRVFGDTLLRELGRARWTALDAGAAWARYSGVRHLVPALEAFLRRGGSIRFIIGIDFQQTSREALDALLALEAHGTCATWVHHNEAGHIFHPKLYLFRGKNLARLFIGSSNLTEGGLFTNVEATMGVRASDRAPFVAGATREVDSWCRDPQLARRLTPALLAKLVADGYVTDEATLPRLPPRGTGAGTGSRSRVFGAVRRAAPRVIAKGKRAQPSAAASGSTNELLMRVRPSRGHVQVQIPIRLARTRFLAAGMSVISSHDRRHHGIHPARARGGVNTLKLEIPEARHFADAVIRFRRRGATVRYRAFDPMKGGVGAKIFARLQSGLATGQTQTTRPRDPARATWWRLV